MTPSTLSPAPARHATRNPLPQASRNMVLPALQQALFASIDLTWQLKQAHWNIKGPQFASLHALFDELTTEQQAHADELAERMTALGGHPLSDVRQVSQHSPLPASPLDATQASELLPHLATAFAELARTLRQGLDSAAEADDPATEDLFTGQLRTLDMRLWFLEAHLG
jgi:starvation-inducible DNA-binding protein